MKQWMLPDIDLDEQIAIRSAIRTRFTFTAQTKLHARIDAGRDVDAQLDRFAFATRSTARRTFVAYDFARPPTTRPRGLDRKEPLRLHALAAPAAIAARFGCAASLGSRTVTGMTGFFSFDFQFASTSLGRFEQ